MSLTISEIKDVIARISYHDWTLYLGFGRDHQLYPYLQWQFWAKDNDTGEMALQKGRKWKLSYHMTHQEVERTAYLALRQAVLHEMDEQYLYRDVAIRNPHVDPDALVTVVSNPKNLISRPDVRIPN